ncbi:MAG: hypothetical protein JO153_01795 [Solirubrobacterales bacterium]|nr:hypothetical protein [Solirubrobacterales bacterium]MBV9915206.1 hypothetical protein [Solirubrobacterales bacterium]
MPEPICQYFTVDIKTGLNGSIVSLLYTQNYFCDLSVRSDASTGCEFGQGSNRLPPGVASRRNTDPLYLMFPSGPLAAQWPTLQPECQHPGLCTDHPSRIDFTRVLGRTGRNMLLPAHDHFETARNGNRPEWHNLYAFMVSNRASWARADQSHDVRTLFSLARTRNSGVRGPFPSNIYFFFQTLPGSPVQQEVEWSTVPSPTVNPPTNYDPSIIGSPDALIDHVISITGNLLSTFFSKTDVRHFTLNPTP